MSSSSRKEITGSEIGLKLRREMSEPVRCSMQIKMYLSELSAEAAEATEKGPARSIEKTSKRFMIGRCSVVW